MLRCSSLGFYSKIENKTAIFVQFSYNYNKKLIPIGIRYSHAVRFHIYNEIVLLIKPIVVFEWVLADMEI